jgi:hypothetical protein
MVLRVVLLEEPGDDTEQDELDMWSAARPTGDWAPKPVHVYLLEITYPEGSSAPGWRPAVWDNPEFLRSLSVRQRRGMKRRAFRWPRERMFLSSSGAYSRASLLRWFGAEVVVHRSHPVIFPPPAPGHSSLEYDASGLPLGF